MTTDRPTPTKSPKQIQRAEREERLAKALRDNLRRRRQQRHEREQPDDGERNSG
ncbi:MAG: hypothetical protein RIM84_24540 [Alphaproteobacteria bacterium]